MSADVIMLIKAALIIGAVGFFVSRELGAVRRARDTNDEPDDRRN